MSKQIDFPADGLQLRFTDSEGESDQRYKQHRQILPNHLSIKLLVLLVRSSHKAYDWHDQGSESKHDCSNIHCPLLSLAQIRSTLPEKLDSYLPNLLTDAERWMLAMADKETDHHHNTSFPATLKEVYKEFRDCFSDCRTEVALEQNDLTFIGVPMALKDRLDPTTLRRSIATMLRISPNYSIVQVVGDSGSAYTSAARAMMKLSIMSAVNSVNMRRRFAVVEYGYTASLHDINWVMNDVFELMDGLKPLTIGNVVYESAKAVEEWGCEASGYVKHFMLAYSEGETAFGDDMWLSDSIMTSDDRDTLICIEGGPQAFYQAATVASKMVTVSAIYGGARKLREENQADSDSLKKKFSAAATLGMLKDNFERMVTNGELVDDFKDELKLSLTLHIEILAADGSALTQAQRALVFQGFDKLIAFPHSFRAIVPQCIN